MIVVLLLYLFIAVVLCKISSCNTFLQTLQSTVSRNKMLEMRRA